MFAFLGLGKKAAQVKAASIRMSKKEHVEATIAVMVGGMYADGQVKPEEQKQFALQLEHNEVFSSYPQAEIGTFADKVMGYYAMGTMMGEKKVMDELKDIGHDKEAGKDICTVLYSMLVADTKEGEEPKLEGKEAAYFEKVTKVFNLTAKEIIG